MNISFLCRECLLWNFLEHVNTLRMDNTVRDNLRFGKTGSKGNPD